MMETNKYYTPSIEEFHVGFELEIKTHELRHWEKHTWLPGDQAKSVSNYLDKIRVKYLDSEDIESLGFKFIKAGWSETSKIFRCNKYRRYELYLREDNTVHISTSSGMTMFDGVVKNKSVLKQVLKMIGVIE